MQHSLSQPLLTLLVGSLSAALYAQATVPLTDLSSRVTASSEPDQFASSGSFGYFAATLDDGSRQVFRTIGTTASTVPVTALTGNTRVLGLRVDDTGTLWFAADTPGGGSLSLFTSDGTPGGTFSLGTIGLGAQTVAADGAVTIGSRYVALTGRTLVLGDATGVTALSLDAIPGGPVPVVGGAIELGATSAGQPIAYAAFGRNGLAGPQIVVLQTDGTSAGTTELAVVSGPSLTLQTVDRLIPFAPGKVLVVTSELFSGGRIAVVDAATGTVTLAATTSSSPSIADFDGIADNGRAVIAGRALVLSVDGNGQATALNTPAAFDGPLRFLPTTPAGTTFAVADTAAGTRLWRLLPGLAGFADDGPIPSAPLGGAAVFGGDIITVLANRVVVRIEDNAAVTELAGTSVSAIQLSPVALPTGVVFQGGRTDREPWITDGTQAGTGVLRDLAVAPDLAGNSTPSFWTPFGGRAAFLASVGDVSQAFVTDGTAPGTTEIATVPTDSLQFFELVAAADSVYLRLDDSLVRTDASGNSAVVAPRTNLLLGAFGDAVLGARQTPTFDTEVVVVRPDGTESTLASRPGTDASVPEVPLLATTGEHTLFAIDTELFVSDGASTNSLFTSSPIERGGAAFDGRVWFLDAAGDWLTTDGTTTAPSGLPNSSINSSLIPAQDVLFHFDPLNSTVSATDGATTSSAPLSNSFSGLETAAPLGNRLMVATSAGLEIVERTPTGAVTINSLAPGSFLGSFLVPVAGELAYIARPQLTTTELWRTDGTPAGTQFLQNLALREMAAIAGNLYLTINDGQTGIEPFVLRPEVYNRPIGSSCSAYPTGTHDLYSDDPRIGQNTQIRGRSRNTGMRAGAVAAVFVGIPALDTPTLPGSKCSFAVDPSLPTIQLNTLLDPAGAFSVNLPIPSVPALVGLDLAVQAVVAPSPSPLIVDFTNGLHWVIGN